jgi:hypothetical protein
MTELTKSLKRKLREQSMTVHEEELRRALEPLAAAFDEWRQAKVGSGELAVRIHDWDCGPCRELWKKYNYGDATLNVAYAIVTGILNPQNIDPALLEYLQSAIEFYRKQMGDETA